MTCTVAPFDKIRTRLMNQPPNAKIYKGFIDCGVKIVTSEGPLGEKGCSWRYGARGVDCSCSPTFPNFLSAALWAGFLPIWARFAPTTTLQLVLFEIIKTTFKIEGGGGD